MANTKLPSRLLDTSAIPALNVTGDLTVDTTTLKVDSTNNRVGIGIASPAHPLHITKELAGYQAYFNNDNGSAQGIKVRIKSNDSGNFNMLELVSASTGSDVTAMVVRDDGNVGIGTDAPSSPLHVSAAKNDGWLAQLINTGTGSDANGLDIHAGVDSSDYILRVREQDGTDVMAVKYGGKVGIGTTNPDSPLEISGADDTRLKLTDTGDSSELMLRSDGVNTQIYTNTAHDLGIYTSGNVGQLHLKQSNGNVGIGTTAPAYKLDISGTSNDLTPLIRGTASNTPSGGFNWATEFIAPNLANDRRLTHIWGKARTNYGMAHISYLPKSTASESYLALGLWGVNDILNIVGNGNVGIGTSTPAVKLQVKTTADGTLQRFSRSGICDWDVSIGNTPIISGGSSGDLEIIPQNANMGFAVGRAGQTGINMRVRDGTLTLGKGIKFNSDTAAANELDDYEEGTFTPVVENGTYTYSYRRGHYTKIGNIVHIHMGFKLNAASPGGAVGNISGLPFNSITYGSYQEPHGRIQAGGLFVTANLSSHLTFYKGNSNTQLYARTTSTNGDSPVNSNQIWQAGTFIKLQMSYTVS